MTNNTTKTLSEKLAELASILTAFRAAGAPLILNYGGGVDSTAMLVLLRSIGIIPDLVIFADTGSEKPSTYATLDAMDATLLSWGWPTITRVRNNPTRATYHNLEEACLTNETLPSLAFGYKSCSLRWKAEPMDAWLLGVKRGPNKRAAWAPAAAALAKGVKPVKLIGYDAGPADSRRAVGKSEDATWAFCYPLRVVGWTREDCITAIKDAGLPVPTKSACFMCPASKEWELWTLAAFQPDLFLRAIRIEDNARDGQHGLDTTVGLGRKWSWRAWAEGQGILRGMEIVMDQAELERKALAAKPAMETACGGCF